MFKSCPVLMDEDMCPELGLAVQNHFQAIDAKLGKGGRHSKHRQSLVTLSRRHSMVQSLENLDLDGPSPNRLHHNPSHPAMQPPMSASKKVKRRISLISISMITNFTLLDASSCIFG